MPASSLRFSASPLPENHPGARDGFFRRPRLRLPIPELDAFLGGGLPCGAITEVVGEASSGRTTLAHALVSAALNAGELAAWIDLPNALDFDDARTCGLDLERLLWVRPCDAPTAFRAAEQVLDVEGFRLVVLDLDLPSRKLPIASSAVWLRLMNAAVRREAALVVLGQMHLTTTFAGLSLETSRRRCAFEGQNGPCPFFRGMATGIHLKKCKVGMLSPTALDIFVTATP